MPPTAGSRADERGRGGRVDGGDRVSTDRVRGGRGASTRGARPPVTTGSCRGGRRSSVMPVCPGLQPGGLTGVCQSSPNGASPRCTMPEGPIGTGCHAPVVTRCHAWGCRSSPSSAMLRAIRARTASFERRRGRRAGDDQHAPPATSHGRGGPRSHMTFDSLGLSADLLRTVAEEGYVEPTPVQAKAIPLVLAGGDVLAAAQTGTGKTAAFTLPILDR